MRDVIPLMNLLEEFGKVVKVTNVKPEIKCKVFEDNTSCIKVATAPSMTPRTKHICIEISFLQVTGKIRKGNYFAYIHNRTKG